MVEGQERQNRETERHRATLLRLLAILFVYAGLADDTGSAAADSGRPGRAMEASREAWTLSRRIFRRLLLLIRPVEAATLRLIAILASGLPIPKPRAAAPERPATPPARSATAAPPGDGKTSPTDARQPLFALADREKRY